MQLRPLEYLVRKYYYERPKSKQMRKNYRLVEQHRELLNSTFPHTVKRAVTHLSDGGRKRTPSCVSLIVLGTFSTLGLWHF